jgi:hypothetical protein
MFFNKKRSKITIALIVSLLTTISLHAQMPQADPSLPESYPDETLEKFVDAVGQIMSIQQEGQMGMVEAIEENDITVERFNELLTEAQQKGPDDIDASEEEKDAFNNSLEVIQTKQREMEVKMEEAVTGAGLDVNLYQSIMQSYETNPEVKEKIDKLFSQQ